MSDVGSDEFQPKAFTDYLIHDVVTAQKNLAQSESDLNRRTLVRTCWSSIEGMVWFIRVLLFEKRRISLEVSDMEVDVLFERSARLTSNGTIQQTVKFVTLPETIKAITKIIRRTYEIDVKFDDAWEVFLKSLKVRNRLTHPRNVSDVEITHEEAIESVRSFYWVLAFTLRITSTVPYPEFVDGKIQFVIDDGVKKYPIDLKEYQKKSEMTGDRTDTSERPK